MFYTSLYIGDLYRSTHVLPDAATDADRVALDAEATRLGSRAMLWQSIVALVGNVVLPSFVSPAAGQKTPNAQNLMGVPWWEKIRRRLEVHMATLWAASHAVFAGCMAGTFFASTVGGGMILIAIAGFSWAVTQWSPFALVRVPSIDSGSTHIVAPSWQRRS